MIRGLNKIANSPGLGYVMSSYTSHPGGREEAKNVAVDIAAQLSLAGLVVFVPIAYGTAIEDAMVNAAWANDEDQVAYVQSHEFWMAMDERFYQRCDYGILAMTPGWHQSTGIAIEYYAFAREGVPIHFLDVENWHIYNPGEVGQKWPDEIDALHKLAGATGAPSYLSEFVEMQSQMAAATIDAYAMSTLKEALSDKA